jgi:hypothetical protein
MSSIAETVPVDAIRERAQQVRLSQVLTTIIAALCFAPGWLLGRAWTGIAYCVLSARVGYWRGTGLTEEQVYARLSPPPEKPAETGPPRPSRL